MLYTVICENQVHGYFHEKHTVKRSVYNYVFHFIFLPKSVDFILLVDNLIEHVYLLVYTQNDIEFICEILYIHIFYFLKVSI